MGLRKMPAHCRHPAAWKSNPKPSRAAEAVLDSCSRGASQRRRVPIEHTLDMLRQGFEGATLFVEIVVAVINAAHTAYDMAEGALGVIGSYAGLRHQ
jgi:hypothetical protein